MIDIRRRGSPGLTIIELLVAVTIAAMLVGLLFPAVQAARESARAAVCQSRLRQLALAVATHADARGGFPQARSEGVVGSEIVGPTPGPTWLWIIRPLLEHAGDPAWPRNAPFDQQPHTVREQVTPLYLCPSRRSVSTAIVESSVGPPRLATCGCILPGATVPSGAVSDYAGNQGDLSAGPDAFYKGGRGTGTIVSTRVTAESHRPVDVVRLRDVQDGLSATLLIGEAHVRQDYLLRLPDTGPAYDGSQFQFTTRVGGPAVGIAAGPDDDAAGTGWMAFGSWHPGGCQVAYADGRVGRLTPDMGSDVLARACHRSDGGLALVDRRW